MRMRPVGNDVVPIPPELTDKGDDSAKLADEIVLHDRLFGVIKVSKMAMGVSLL